MMCRLSQRPCPSAHFANIRQRQCGQRGQVFAPQRKIPPGTALERADARLCRDRCRGSRSPQRPAARGGGGRGCGEARRLRGARVAFGKALPCAGCNAIGPTGKQGAGKAPNREIAPDRNGTRGNFCFFTSCGCSLPPFAAHAGALAASLAPQPAGFANSLIALAGQRRYRGRAWFLGILRGGCICRGFCPSGRPGKRTGGRKRGVPGFTEATACPARTRVRGGRRGALRRLCNATGHCPRPRKGAVPWGAL